MRGDGGWRSNLCCQVSTGIPSVASRGNAVRNNRMDRAEPWWEDRYGDVDVLAWNLDEVDVPDSLIRSHLSAGEIEAVGRARTSGLRRRRLLSRSLLRAVLARRTDTPAPLLDLRSGPHGKPYLPTGPAFNAAHSGAFFMVALRATGRVGVDLEVVRPSADLLQVAERHFSAREWEEIQGEGPNAARTFFRTWVRKEAFLKGLGAGLSLPLHSFVVSGRLAPPGRNVLQHIDFPGESTETWTVCSISAPEGTEAALAWDTP